MTKKLLAIPQGNLMRVAASKNITTQTDLKEKTGVDRKTLRAIDNGQPVKEATLQVIANKLRVPLAHLVGRAAADKPDDVSGADAMRTIAPGYCDIRLQRLDVAALRRLAMETDEITWFLKLDQMPDELEKLLLRLGKSLRGWFFHREFGAGEQDDLLEQISQIKASTEIDKCVEELAQHNLKIFGATYVAWDSERPRHHVEDYPLPILSYTSQLKVALSIASDENSTVRVFKGSEPPPKIVESELLSDIDYVEIDGKVVWSRETFADKAKQFGLIDGDDIPF